LNQTPEIKMSADSIVKRENNTFKQARLLHQWVNEKMTYAYPPKARGACVALEYLSGDFGKYADLFIAFARSLRNPARLQAGFVFAAERISYHVWAEIYLPVKRLVPCGSDPGKRLWLFRQSVFDCLREHEYAFEIRAGMGDQSEFRSGEWTNGFHAVGHHH